MANYQYSYRKSTGQYEKAEGLHLKKWVIQVICSLIVFSLFYIARGYEGNVATQVNQFYEYVLTHNTDFYAVYQNTAATITNAASMLLESKDKEVFHAEGNISETNPSDPVPESTPVSESAFVESAVFEEESTPTPEVMAD